MEEMRGFQGQDRPPWSVRVMISHAWVQLGLLYGAVGAGLAALGPAALGESQYRYNVVIIAVVGAGSALLQDYWRERAYWRLTRSERWQLWHITTTASPMGDARLDQMGLERMKTAQRNAERSNRVFLAVFAASVAAAPVVAAVRVSYLWLLASTPVLTLALLIGQRPSFARTRQARLAALQSALQNRSAEMPRSGQ